MSYREPPTYRISFLFRRILVPIDGSENSLRALDLAVDLAKHYGSKITVVYAKPMGVKTDVNPLEKAKQRVGQAGVEVDFKMLEYDISNSSSVQTLLNEIVEGGYDLVIMGARGLTLSSEKNVGSVALSIVSNSPVTVIIVR